MKKKGKSGKLTDQHGTVFNLFTTSMAFLLICMGIICTGWKWGKECKNSSDWISIFRSERTAIVHPKKKFEDYMKEHGNSTFFYTPFQIQEPNFLHESDVELFNKNEENMNVLKVPSSDLLRGMIQFIPNGTVHDSYDCGWQMNPRHFERPPVGARIRHKFKAVCPLLVPQSNSFQHFLDGVVPKLVQASAILNFPNVKYIVYRPWDRIIEEILVRFGISENNIYFYDGGYISAEYVINTCITPPIHPELWASSRTYLGAPTNIEVPLSDAFVILLARERARNYGRNIKNSAQVQAFLKARYGDKFHVFIGKMNLDESVYLFSRARIVIGVHGGAFYNMFFCPSETHFLEIMPTDEAGSYVPRNLAHNIVWKMANLLNQTYWRMSETPLTSFGDINVNIDKLKLGLDAIDNMHLMHQVPATHSDV